MSYDPQNLNLSQIEVFNLEFVSFRLALVHQTATTISIIYPIKQINPSLSYEVISNVSLMKLSNPRVPGGKLEFFKSILNSEFRYNSIQLLKWKHRDEPHTVFNQPRTHIGAIGSSGTDWRLSLPKPGLPDVESLRTVKLQTPLQIFTSDGQLIAQFGEKHRDPVSINEVPLDLVRAFLAAEDDNFRDHVGIDPLGLARAAWQLVSSGQIQSGGSTITMQVAKNYFLSHERTFARKFREILLALEIEKTLSKDEILELYFNVIFLGHRAYGVNAASQIYYGKNLDELTLAQAAMIAGLPKAPSKYNPIANPERAKERRDWILGRMLKLGFIEEYDFEQAIERPVTASLHGVQLDLTAPYVAEEARRIALEIFDDRAYTDGLRVFTTINGEQQKYAQNAVVRGLMEYDRRHGWRGVEQSLVGTGLFDWKRQLMDIEKIGSTPPGRRCRRFRQNHSCSHQR